MANNTHLNNFENMLKLAEFGAKQHSERRQVIFRIFISYMTLLVVICGLIMKHWKDDIIEQNLFLIPAILFLFAMLVSYFLWLKTFYKAADYDVRRRDFYLVKAQVICYYMSECLNQHYSGCKQVPVNLGNRKNYQVSEKCLFKKRRPDINPKLYAESPCPPTVSDNPHFWFHLLGPAGLTTLIIIGLVSKIMN